MFNRKLIPMLPPKALPALLCASRELPQVTSEGGFDWECGHCPAVLASRIAEDQLIDYVFLCPKCGGYSASTHRN